MDVKFSLLDLWVVSPLIALFLFSIIPLTVKVFNENREGNPFVTMSIGLLGVILATGLIGTYKDISGIYFQDALVIDGASVWLGFLIMGVTAVTLIFSRENMATRNRHFSEFVFLLLNAAIGMLVVVWSNDLIIAFIGIEMMSLCLYVLIALSSEERLSKESAFKYFVLSSFASAVLLYGLAFIYGLAGTTYLHELVNRAPDLMGHNLLFTLGVVLAAVGLAFKVALVPFHAWAADVYQGAPTPITAFMATGVKAVSFALFLRVVLAEVMVSPESQGLVHFLQWLAVLTMLVGNIAAISQSHFKRMLAYSSVAHSGYVMMGLIAAGMAGPMGDLAIRSVLYYVTVYAVMTLGAFGVISLMEKRSESSIHIEDLRGMAQRNPWVALFIAIFMLGLAGIPPTVGFFGKLYVFTAALDQKLYWLVFWGVVSSAIGLYYYLRPIVVMYMEEQGEGADAVSSRQLTSFTVAMTALLVLFAGILF